MESELLISIMSSLAESESASISENEKWGIRHRFENGTFKIGYAPYGYNVKNGVFSINEDEAKWVRYIFSEVLSGKGTAAIARDLEERQVPTRKKGRWTSTTIRGIIKNEKYIGDCTFQKTYSDFRFKRHNNRGERDQFYVRDHHEPIVSREDFEAAGALIQQRAKEKGIDGSDKKYQNRYPFSGKIICGECGSTFKRKVNYTGNLRYPSWSCKEHVDHIENCSMKPIKEDALERTFMIVMNKLVFTRKEILQVLLESVRGENHKICLRRINQIDAQLADITEQNHTLTQIMAKGYLEPAVFKQESNRLAAEEKELTEERTRLLREVNGNINKTDALNDLVKYANRGRMLKEFDGELVERFIDHIEIHSHDELSMHFKCGLVLRERIQHI